MTRTGLLTITDEERAFGEWLNAMAAQELLLSGCSPTPLARYLKALAVLRLVSEQKDAGATAYWGEGGYILRSSLSEEDLEQFFLEEYRPTPIVAPWNGGSGFFPKDNRKAISQIAEAVTPRLAEYRDTVHLCGELLKAAGVRSNPDTQVKHELRLACRNALPDARLPWLNAVFVLTADGSRCPPLLGTGGNDGRLEFTNNFMQCVLALLSPDTGAATDASPRWLRGALWGETVPGLVGDLPIGQFQPGSAGGSNMGGGFDASSLGNSWDFVLMIEGALLFAATVTRRLESVGPATLSYPFTVRTTGAGSGNIAGGDSGSSRAETWMPLWGQPAGLREIRTLLSEGRAVVSRRQAKDGTDFARAVASLSVDRGITAFERYGYLERNGLAYLAVPLGRWEVTPRPHVDLLRELDSWLDRFGRVARGKEAPASYGRALNRIDAAIMAVCRDGSPHRWQDLLVALGEAEAAMVASPQTTLGGQQRQSLRPLPTLSREWLESCRDDSPELRLATGLASILGARKGLGSLRSNMVPLDPGKPWRFNEAAHMRDNAVVWGDADLAGNLIAVLTRRCLDADRHNLNRLPVYGNAPVPLADVARFVAGQADETRLAALLWGLNAVKWDGDAIFPDSDDHGAPPLRNAYALLKLLFLPGDIEPEPDATAIAIPPTPTVSHLAAAGRMADASRAAVRRLRGSGLSPAVEVLAEAPAVSRRIAAALLFPISLRDVSLLTKRVLRVPVKV